MSLVTPAFILTQEPLLHHVSSQLDIHRLTVDQTTHKLRAHDNNLFFFATQPLIFLPLFLWDLQFFLSLSNYKINLQKSEVRNVSLPFFLEEHVKPHFSWKWASRAITYLCTQISADISMITLIFSPYPPTYD